MLATSTVPKVEASARAAFEREALPHLQALFFYALRLAAHDESRAEDLVQETILHAYRSWHTYERDTNCKAWLMAILRNVVFTEHAMEVRSRDLNWTLLSDPHVFSAAESQDPEGAFFRRIVDDTVLKAIDRLPALKREALVLKDLAGLSYEEIAQVLGVPLGTVKSRLFRARRALQNELYEYAVAMGYVRPRPVDTSGGLVPRPSPRSICAPTRTTHSPARTAGSRGPFARSRPSALARTPVAGA